VSLCVCVCIFFIKPDTTAIRLIIDSSSCCCYSIDDDDDDDEYNNRLEDLVAQDDIVTILTNLIDHDNLPHLLLYGPPGT
jgi:hypothetical protein